MNFRGIHAVTTAT